MSAKSCKQANSSVISQELAQVGATSEFATNANGGTGCSIPTLASISKLRLEKELQIHNPKVPATF